MLSKEIPCRRMCSVSPGAIIEPMCLLMPPCPLCLSAVVMSHAAAVRVLRASGKCDLVSTAINTLDPISAALAR